MKTEGATAAMGLQQIAASLLTGKITLQEAATWLATKAQTAFNTVLSANPVVLVTAAVAGLVAGLAVLVTWLATTQGSAKEYNEAVEKMNKSGEEAKEAAENFGKALSGIGDGADEFVESINNSKSALDGIDDSVILNAQKMDELQKNMEEVQTEITKITSSYSDERKGYTEEEIQALDDLFKRQLELVEQQLQEMSTYQTVASGRAESFVRDFSGTSEEYAEESKKYVKAAQDAKDKVITAAEEQYNKQLAQITLMKGLSEEERKSKEKAAKRVYDDAISAANKEYSDTMSIIIDGYNERSNAAVDFQNKMAGFRKDRLKIMDEYNKKAAEINEKYANDEEKHRIEITKITDKYNQDMTDLFNEHNKDFDDSTKEELSIWLGFIKSVEENGGQITQETANMCQNMLDELSILPPESKAEMQDTIDKMQEVMDTLPPAMRKKAEEVSSEWINGVSGLSLETYNAFKKLGNSVGQGYADGISLAKTAALEAGAKLANDVIKKIQITQQSNSPSKRTRKLGHDFSDGYALGIDDNQDEAEKSASNLVKNALSSIGNKIQSTVVRTKMAVAGRFSGFDSAFSEADIVNRLKSAVVSQSSSVSQALSARGTSMTFSSNNSSGSITASGNIQTHISIDGREFAVATTPYIDEELAFSKR